MNDEEIRSTIEQVKAQLKAKPENAEKSEDEIDEMILDGFYDEFSAGKMSKEDLEALANAMGYEFSEDFAADEGPAKGEGEGEGEGITKAEAEETKVIEPGESKEDFKDKIEDIKEDESAPADKGDDVEEDEEEEESEDIVDDDDEEAQRAKASEFYRMKL